MSDVIRHGTIVVDLVQGKVELKPPDMGPVIAARQKEIELIGQIEAGQKRLIDLQNQMLRPGSGGGGGGTAPGGGGTPGGGAIPGMPSPQVVDEAAKAQRELAAAYREAGEGVMRVGRAFVLLSGASGESMQKMVQGLALVQGAYDLFAGSQKILDNLAKAEQALAAAQALTTASTVANTGATVANTAATTGLTGATVALAAAEKALAAVTNPVTLGLAALAAVVMTVVEAYDYFTTSAAEARESALAQAKVNEVTIAGFEKELAITRQIVDLRRSLMTDAEKGASLEAEAASAHAAAMMEIDLARGKSTEAEAVARNFAAQQHSQAAAALKERVSLEKSILDTQLRQKENAIEAIKRQDDLVKAAQRQVDVEKQKTDAMQAQIGRLSTLQQSQLKSLRDKLLRGEDLSRGEEGRLDELGGEQGRAIVDARAKKRAEAAGFGPDFFKGIEGASSGMDDAAKKLKEAAEALKALTQGATAAAKIAAIEADKKQLESQMAEFRKSISVAFEALIKDMRANAQRLHELEITNQINAAAG